MANHIPDPRTLETWEDAFQYPIPAVSGMEKKLRANVRENHEKLRTLVGYEVCRHTSESRTNASHVAGLATAIYSERHAL